jgi:hypothetical protein
MRQIAFGFALGWLCLAASAQAHHGPSVLGTVTIAQPAMAGGTMLQPGTYEVRLTGEHMAPLPGQSENAAQVVEFVSDGRVVARDAAEVIESDVRPVGTSGRTQAGLRIEPLRGGEFLRISTTRGGERYLIHLATRASR